MTDDLARLAEDRTSSATALTGSAAALLRHARAEGPAALREVAVRLCSAQPSMGAIRNLAAAALEPDDRLLERVAGRAARSAAAVATHARTLLREDTTRIVTCSRSAVVETCIRALGVPAVCAESRPGLEGRALAACLAGNGIDVEVVADAAIASSFRSGDTVLVGADAIAADWLINKTGTGQLCAAALLAGVPAYVVSGLEKCVGATLAPTLTLRDDRPETLWDAPPPGVRIGNPLFERVPLDRVVGLISDAGLLAGEMVRAACESVVPVRAARALADLLARGST